MFTTIAWNDARAGSQATLLAMAAVADQHVRAVGNDIIVPDLANIIGVLAAHGTQAAAGSVLLAQIVSPSLRAMILKDIAEGWDTNSSMDSEQVEMFPTFPIPVRKDESLNALMANGALASARGMVALWLADGPLKPITGNIMTVRCTTVITGVANTWVNGVLTPVQSLPAGKYQVVGMSAILAGSAGIARLVFVGGQWRPGVPIRIGLMKQDYPEFRYGNLGVWGEFNHNTPPSVDMISIAAVNNPDIYLDLIKTG